MRKTIYSSLLFFLIISLLFSCLDYEKEHLPLGEVKLQMTNELSENSNYILAAQALLSKPLTGEVTSWVVTRFFSKRKVQKTMAVCS